MYYKVKVKSEQREFWYNATFSLESLVNLINTIDKDIVEIVEVEESNAQKPNKYKIIKQDLEMANFEVGSSQIIWLRGLIEKEYGSGEHLIYVESFGLKDGEDEVVLEDGIVTHMFERGDDSFGVTEYTKCTKHIHSGADVSTNKI